MADETEVVLGFFSLGDQIPLVAEEDFAEDWEGHVTVNLNGLYAYVPEVLVLAEGKTYEAWDGYSYWNGVVYDNYYLLGDLVSHSGIPTGGGTGEEWFPPVLSFRSKKGVAYQLYPRRINDT